MRVLLQSLHRAARDYRARGPVPSRGVARARVDVARVEDGVALVPMLTLKPPLRRVGLAAGLLLAALAGAGAMAAFQAGEKPAPVAVVAKTDDGIALPVETLETRGDVAEVTRQLATLPALGGQETPVKDSGPSSVEVSESALAPVDDFLAAARTASDGGDFAAAVTFYDKILALAPENEAAWAGKIYALEQTGAQDELTKLAAAHPNLAVAQMAAARVWVRQGDRGAALGAWKKAVTLAPEDPAARLGLAVLYDRAGDRDAALENYKKIKAPTAEVRRRVAYLEGSP